MANRPSASLKSGAGVILGVPDHMATMSMPTPRDVGDMSIQEMESVLREKFHKRLPETVRANDGPQTARGILEENKKLIADQQERRSAARKNSRDEFDKLVVQDRLTTEGEKARVMSRRQAQRELANYYKEKIGEKEKAKANEYSNKKDNGVAIQYFPFIEGETIDKNRAAKSANMREEMRDFLQQQRDLKPPRPDAKNNDAIESPVELAMNPRFLSRAHPHMSRRLQDGHVRKTLEDKVRTTKAELEAAAQQREMERQQWEESLLVNDALRYDKDQAKMAEKKRTAQFLLNQMEEHKHQAAREHTEKRTERPAYWGPEEKQPQPAEIHRDHCKDIIQQMEVVQNRRLNSRSRRLRQERQIVDNGLAEMSQDREKERTKANRHREVLTTTWQSQQKIRQALTALEA